MNLIETLMKLDREKLTERQTGEVEIKRLSQLCGEPFVVKCQAIPGARYTELASTMTDENGKADFAKIYHASTLMVLDGVLEPDLKDKKLQEHFKCKTPKDLAEVLFVGGDMQTVANLITELSGYGENADDEIKN